MVRARVYALWCATDTQQQAAASSDSKQRQTGKDMSAEPGSPQG
jgi:hypothetical protein